MKSILFLIYFFCITNAFAQTTANLNFSNQSAISPYIFGFNQDHQTIPSPERWTIRRLGGNRLTTFNWENGASNAGPNYTNDNRIPSLCGVLFASKDIPGEAYRVFHQTNLNASVVSLITVPLLGFVAADKDGLNTTASNSARWHDLIYKKPTAFSLSPNTTDEIVYMDESIYFLKQTFGSANTSTGVKYISLDNEPAYWDATHANLQTSPMNAATYVQKFIDAAKAVKAVDPAVKIVAGEFALSNIYDFGLAPDWPVVGAGYDWFLSYFLDKVKQASDAAGYNLLDVISFHFYPKHQIDANGNYDPNGTVVLEANNTTDIIRSTRMSFTRSLWDETYIEPSRLTDKKLNGAPQKLLIRLQNSINTYFPGTKMMIGEYDYGFDADISHGIGMADFFGAAASKNLEIATRWDLDAYNTDTYTETAVRLFRNYNAANGTYGDKTVGVTFTNADKSSVWASVDSDDGDLHLILLNKDIYNDRTFTVNLNETGMLYNVKDRYSFNETSKAIFSEVQKGTVSNAQYVVTVPKLTATHVVISRSSVITAISDFSTPQAIKIYPNPANQLVFIDNLLRKIKPGEIRILDIAGRDHTAEVIVSGNSSFIQIDVKKLHTGLYFLKTKTATQKFEVMR